MAGLHSDLEQLHSSYNTFVNHGNDDDDESDNESPPFFYGSGQPTSNWYQQQAQNTDDDDHHLPKLKNTKPHDKWTCSTSLFSSREGDFFQGDGKKICK